MNKLFYFIFLLPCFFACQPSQKEESQQPKISKQDLMEANRLLIQKDKAKIAAYIERHELKMEESPTGLWYCIESAGAGPLAQADDIISLRYKLSLLDGTLCYSSDEDGIKTFKVGKGGVESGLEQAVLMLNQGAKATLILPPHLGHGLPGDGQKIPARAVLIYELEVVSLSKP